MKPKANPYRFPVREKKYAALYVLLNEKEYLRIHLENFVRYQGLYIAGPLILGLISMCLCADPRQCPLFHNAENRQAQ